MAERQRPRRPRWNPSPSPIPTSSIEAPPPLRLQRERAPGRYPLLDVFRGLDRTPGFVSLPAPAERLRATARAAHVVLVEEDAWMYVAPRVTPEEVRRFGYEMVMSSGDAIVVGRNHLGESPSLVVYLDIIHEFLHLLQRAEGRELWEGKVAYVDRPTEIEAYQHSVAEARRLGLTDEYLRDYLQVEWVPPTEFRRLLRHLKVRDGPTSPKG